MNGATTPATVRIMRMRIPRVTCRFFLGGSGSEGASAEIGASGSSSMAIGGHGTARHGANRSRERGTQQILSKPGHADVQVAQPASARPAPSGATTPIRLA